jgi:hypothetical protein
LYLTDPFSGLYLYPSPSPRVERGLGGEVK